MKNRLKRHLFTQRFIIMLSLPLNHLALAGTEITIDDAKFEHNDLYAQGEFKGELPESDSIILYDAITNTVISVTNQSEKTSHFSFKISNLQQIPCYIKVQAGVFSAIKEVKHAPYDCSAPAPKP